MSQLLVRNVDDSLKDELKRSARRNGRSLEAEVRIRLRDSVEASRVALAQSAAEMRIDADDEEPSEGLGTQLRQIFSGIGFTEEELAGIRALRAKPRPDPYFWRDYGKHPRDHGFTEEDIERIESIKREPILDRVNFE